MKIKTKMPKSGKLITAYKQGGENFRKYCLTYGTISDVTDFDDFDGLPCREYQVLIDGITANVGMKRGEVVTYGISLIEA